MRCDFTQRSQEGVKLPNAAWDAPGDEALVVFTDETDPAYLQEVRRAPSAACMPTHPQLAPAHLRPSLCASPPAPVCSPAPPQVIAELSKIPRWGGGVTHGDAVVAAQLSGAAGCTGRLPCLTTPTPLPPWTI